MFSSSAHACPRATHCIFAHWRVSSIGGMIALILLSIFASCSQHLYGAQQSNDVAKLDNDPQQDLKRLSLEDLGNIEVRTFSKAPTPLRQTPAAIYVITNEQILRSGAIAPSEVRGRG